MSGYTNYRADHVVGPIFREAIKRLVQHGSFGIRDHHVEINGTRDVTINLYVDELNLHGIEIMSARFTDASQTFQALDRLTTGIENELFTYAQHVADEKKQPFPWNHAEDYLNVVVSPIAYDEQRQDFRHDVLREIQDPHTALPKVIDRLKQVRVLYNNGLLGDVFEFYEGTADRIAKDVLIAFRASDSKLDYLVAMLKSVNAELSEVFPKIAEAFEDEVLHRIQIDFENPNITAPQILTYLDHLDTLRGINREMEYLIDRNATKLRHTLSQNPAIPLLVLEDPMITEPIFQWLGPHYSVKSAAEARIVRFEHIENIARMLASPHYYRLQETKEKPWKYTRVSWRLRKGWPNEELFNARNRVETLISKQGVAVPDGGGAGEGGMDLWFFTQDEKLLRKSIEQACTQCGLDMPIIKGSVSHAPRRISPAYQRRFKGQQDTSVLSEAWQGYRKDNDKPIEFDDLEPGNHYPNHNDVDNFSTNTAVQLQRRHGITDPEMQKAWQTHHEPTGSVQRFAIPQTHLTQMRAPLAQMKSEVTSLIHMIHRDDFPGFLASLGSHDGFLGQFLELFKRWGQIAEIQIWPVDNTLFAMRDAILNASKILDQEPSFRHATVRVPRQETTNIMNGLIRLETSLKALQLDQMDTWTFDFVIERLRTIAQSLQDVVVGLRLFPEITDHGMPDQNFRIFNSMMDRAYARTYDLPGQIGTLTLPDEDD